MTDQLAAAVMSTADHERLGYLRCNTLGHAWHDYDSNWNTEMGSPLTLRCERCGTERRDVIGTYGQLVTRSYAYPDQYRYPKGSRPSRSDFRVMLLVQRLQEQRKDRRKAEAKIKVSA